MNEEKDYYSSHSKLPFITGEAQEKIRRCKVLVIGAGGLGCPCLLALAGAGVGTIGIADFDVVSVSNLHRQNLYSFADEGKKKVTVARKKLSLYNPFIAIQAHDVLVYEKTVLELLKNYDIVIDCTDNFLARYLINDACVYLDKPLVYGAIHRTEGHVTVFNYRGSATLRCLFPKDDTDTTQSCADIGAYNIITGVIGLLMANETIKIIATHNEVLAGTLLSTDVLSGTMMKTRYELIAGSIGKSKQRFQAAVTNAKGNC
jgi:sulfur-carrier protein adenylyltransferase/sulfurtransferase